MNIISAVISNSLARTQVPPLVTGQPILSGFYLSRGGGGGGDFAEANL